MRSNRHFFYQIKNSKDTQCPWKGEVIQIQYKILGKSIDSQNVQITFRENIFSNLIPQRLSSLFSYSRQNLKSTCFDKNMPTCSVQFPSHLMGGLRNLCYSTFLYNEQSLTQRVYKLSRVLRKNISITENTNCSVERSWPGSTPEAYSRCNTQTLIPQVSVPFCIKDSQNVQPEKWI